ncbi:hypothetical protein VW23_021760 [Devosia insulae DS-56]|uniref:CopG family transcriptional regulator n=1 Tax=Devosia insulae DS-56 TaxID=1116389 RepID=A0A1E5XP32_9HYPH|nr:hypothetical protein VW23_021760 [Devosia insulae DS-56]
MPKGDSGRVVIEVDPGLKRRLYSALAIEGSTLKDWFITAAGTYVKEREQPSLPEIDNKKTDHRQ